MTKDGKPLPPNLYYDEEKHKYVTIRNDLHETAYYLDAFEQKLFFEILARIDTFESKEQIISLSVKDLEKIGVSYATRYRRFDRACEKVLKLSLRFYSETEEDSEGNRIFEEEAVNIFSSQWRRGVKDKAGNKRLSRATFKINPDISPYLTAITKDMRFTKVLIEQTRKLKKAASIRLYQWLRKSHWVNINRELTTVDEIKVFELIDKLDFNERKINARKAWRDFKRYVLDPACEDINQHSDMHTWYKTIKHGRGGKIHGVVFYAQNREDKDDKEARNVPADQTTVIELTEVEKNIKTMLQPYLPNITDGMTKQVAAFDAQTIFKAMLVFSAQTASKTVENKEPLFVKILLSEAKEAEKEIHNRVKTTQEKLTDRSWAEGLSFDEFDDV